MDDELKANWLDPMYELDEKEVWTVLAHLWKTTTQTLMSEPIVEIPEGGSVAYGLCGCIDNLLGEKRIDVETYFILKAKILLARPKDRTSNYNWPLTFVGAGERAAFCRRMADAC